MPDILTKLSKYQFMTTSKLYTSLSVSGKHKQYILQLVLKLALQSKELIRLRLGLGRVVALKVAIDHFKKHVSACCTINIDCAYLVVLG